KRSRHPSCVLPSWSRARARHPLAVLSGLPTTTGRGWTGRMGACLIVGDGSSSRSGRSMTIVVDADACPVKDEVYRVARRHGVRVCVVSNAALFVPKDALVELVVVRGGFDSADDWIAGHIGPGDIAVTADIPLADRCLKAGARVLSPKGQAF